MCKAVNLPPPPPSPQSHSQCSAGEACCSVPCRAARIGTGWPGIQSGMDTAWLGGVPRRRGGSTPTPGAALPDAHLDSLTFPHPVPKSRRENQKAALASSHGVLGVSPQPNPGSNPAQQRLKTEGA